MLSTDMHEREALFIVIDYLCPPEFDADRQNLKIRGLKWIGRHSRPNSIADFDPLSREMLATELGAKLYPFETVT